MGVWEEGKPPCSGVHPGGGLGKPENKRFMAFKKTICEDIWLVFMTINAQVFYSCAQKFPPPNFGWRSCAIMV